MVRKAFPAKIVLSLLLAFVLMGGVVVAGAALRDNTDDPVASASQESTTSTAPTTTTSTLPATTVPTLPQLVQPSPATDLPVVDLVTTIGPGAYPGVVLAFEQRLADTLHHAAVHLTTNVVVIRFSLYVLSVGLQTVMAVRLALQLL